MGFFRDIKYDIKWLCEDIVIKCKHPDRPGEFGYHWSKLWDHVIGHPWYALKRGIKNLYRWFPLIWRNDVWDYFQLCEMMDKQLGDMEKFWEDQAAKERTSDWDHEKGWRCQYRRIHKRIKWCRILMAMWRDEHYAMKAYDVHTTLFPRAGSLFDKDNIAKTTYDKWGEPLSYEMKPMADDERDHFRNGSDKARLMDEKVFKLWQKNLGFIRNWWH